LEHDLGASGKFGIATKSVRVFIACFTRQRLQPRVQYLESSRNFFYRNCSVRSCPKEWTGRPAPGTAQTDQSGRGGRDSAGLYGPYREWVDFELNCAKGFDKPVVVLNTFGVKMKLPFSWKRWPMKSSTGMNATSSCHQASGTPRRIHPLGHRGIQAGRFRGIQTGSGQKLAQAPEYSQATVKLA
jgi:hypothetical protein